MSSSEYNRAYCKAYYHRKRQDPEYVAKRRVEAREQQRIRRAAKAPEADRLGPCEVCTTVCRRYFDHDHATNTFRGWLCMHCNVALGHLKDSPQLCESAAAYLRKHQ